MKIKSFTNCAVQKVSFSPLQPGRKLGLALVSAVMLLPLWLISAEQKETPELAGTLTVKGEDAGGSATVDFEPSDFAVNEITAHKNAPYLGVATSEAPEALTAQLGLKPGAGLVVNHIAPESPAAKSGLQKNDLLVRLDDESLVLPAQLRKLIQVRKAGDTVRIEFYRGGKPESASVVLGKSRPGFLEEHRALQKRIEIPNKPSEQRDLDEVIENSLENAHVDRKELHQEIRRRMEEVRAAIKEALRDVTDVASDLDPVRNILRDLNKSGVRMEKNAAVTVRTARNGVKSVVTADESGTIVIVQNPKMHLTAHDKEGRMLFDGEIETTEQRDKMPRDLRERVEPLVDKIKQ